MKALDLQISRVALYARRARVERDAPKPKDTEEYRALVKYASERDWVIAAEFFDWGYSGNDMKRPGLNEMLDAIKRTPPLFDAVLVRDHFRLARSPAVREFVERTLEAQHIQIHSLTDKSCPSSALQRGILAAITAHYLRNLRKEIIRGLMKCAAQGCWTGGVPPFGYRLEKIIVGENIGRKRLVIDKSEKRIVEVMFNAADNGESIRNITGTLGQQCHMYRGKSFTTRHVRRILTNRVYTGKYIFGAESDHPVEVPIPAIVNEDLFDRVQERLKRSRTGQISSRNRKIKGF